MTKLAFGAAAAVIAATLVDDTVARSALSHERSPAIYAFAAVLAAALLALAPRVRSRVVSLGAGVAFNLADLAIAVGDALLIGGAPWQAVRNRDRLRERVF